MVGGTDEDGDWSRTPSPETATAILRRATRLVPALADARSSAIGSGCGRCARRCGWRPRAGSSTATARAAAGVTLSWGCADEVTRLVEHWRELGGASASPGDSQAPPLERPPDVSGPTRSRPVTRGRMRPMARDFKTIGVVGLGTMGAGITEVFARNGYSVVGVEVDDDGVARGRQHLEHSTARAVARGKLSEDDAKALHDRVTLRHLAGGAQGRRPRRRGGGRVRRDQEAHLQAARRHRLRGRDPRDQHLLAVGHRDLVRHLAARAASSACTSSTPRRCRASSRSCGPW